MDVFDLIFGERNRDPYETGRTGRYSKFFETGVFSTTTAHGFTVQYELWCNYEKVDHDAFRHSRMLEPESQKHFLRRVNTDVVTRLLNSKGRFVRIFPDTSILPQLCRAIELEGKQCVARDLNCAELIDELCEARFKADGCVTGKMLLKFRPYNASEQIIDKNFEIMQKHFDIDSIRANPVFAAQEEAWMIALAKGEIELRKRFALQRLSQDHTSRRLFVRARVIGGAIEIQWQLTDNLAPGERIKGLRYKDGNGFGGENTDCIVDSASGGSVALSLPAGTQQFFSLQITANRGAYYSPEDTINFTIRIPTAAEQAEFDAFLTKGASKAPPLSEKTKAAMEELLSFVEFDEHVSELEKQLVARITAKDYSEEEKAERVNRLKLLVESIHLQS